MKKGKTKWQKEMKKIWLNSKSTVLIFIGWWSILVELLYCERTNHFWLFSIEIDFSVGVTDDGEVCACIYDIISWWSFMWKWMMIRFISRFLNTSFSLSLFMVWNDDNCNYSTGFKITESLCITVCSTINMYDITYHLSGWSSIILHIA